MSTPTYPLRIDHGNSNFIDYKISHELPSFDCPVTDSVANEHSIVVRLTYNKNLKKAYGSVTYEQNGDHYDIGGELKLTDEQFYRITNHPAQLLPEDKLATLRSVKGSVTIKDGVATLPDGSQVTL
jgi:hypothetical protein